jgi:hypothetical protein
MIHSLPHARASSEQVTTDTLAYLEGSLQRLEMVDLKMTPRLGNVLFSEIRKKLLPPHIGPNDKNASARDKEFLIELVQSDIFLARQYKYHLGQMTLSSPRGILSGHEHC